MALKPGQFGVHVFRYGNVMPKMCDNCPFGPKGKRIELAPARLEGIKFVVTMGQPFWCHKTVIQDKRTEYVEVDGHEKPASYASHYRQCAGSLAWAERLKKRLEHE